MILAIARLICTPVRAQRVPVVTWFDGICGVLCPRNTRRTAVHFRHIAARGEVAVGR